MAIPPLGPSSPNLPAATLGKSKGQGQPQGSAPDAAAEGPRARIQRDAYETPQKRIDDAELEASRQIMAATDHVEETKKELARREEQARDAGNDAYEVEVSSQEDRLLKTRADGYEQIQKIKRQQEAELNRLRREGEKQLDDTKAYYRDQTYKALRDGESKLNEMHAKNSSATDIEFEGGRREVEQIRKNQVAEIARAQAAAEHSVNEVHESAHRRVEEMNANALQAEEQAQTLHEEQFNHRMANRDTVINRMDAAAAAQIKQIRQDTAAKLAAYSSRQEDPFYKMLDTGAQLSDEGEYFVLTARIPEHEQSRVNVSMQGNRLVLSGARRNEERLDLGEGRTRGSSSFQSYSESFALDFPVNAKLITKEFDGDMMIARIPKTSSFTQDPTPHKIPERARAERPHFPDNLPGIAQSPASGKPLG